MLDRALLIDCRSDRVCPNCDPLEVVIEKRLSIAFEVWGLIDRWEKEGIQTVGEDLTLFAGPLDEYAKLLGALSQILKRAGIPGFLANHRSAHPLETPPTNDVTVAS